MYSGVWVSKGISVYNGPGVHSGLRVYSGVWCIVVFGCVVESGLSRCIVGSERLMVSGCIVGVMYIGCGFGIAI